MSNTMNIEIALKILGVSSNCSIDQVRSAWKMKAKQLHPDAGGDPAAFDKALKAYEAVLGYIQEGPAAPGTQRSQATPQPKPQPKPQPATWVYSKPERKPTAPAKTAKPVRWITATERAQVSFLWIAISYLGLWARLSGSTYSVLQIKPGRKTIMGWTYYDPIQVQSVPGGYLAIGAYVAAFGFILGWFWLARSKRSSFKTVEKFLVATVLVSISFAGEFILAEFNIILAAILYLVYANWVYYVRPVKAKSKA